jgi:light-regulated signal transduction histidine kinase (bacteriophytochrome)
MKFLLDKSQRNDRLTHILESLKKLENCDSREVKNIVAAVTELKEYLVVSDKAAEHYESRINSIMEVLLKYTLMDFSVQATVSELGDDLDAIAVGINTLAEELQDKIVQEQNNSEKLHEQNVKLERTNRELASFAYVSSHDLQEPLRKINTYISRLVAEDTDKLPEQMRFYLERVRLSATRMQNLIRDILEYSKLSTSDEEVQFIHLHQLTQEVKDDFEEGLAEKKGTFEFNVQCDVRIVPFQYKRLLSNLLSNSLKFADPSHPLQISLTSMIASGKELGHISLAKSKKYCHLVYTDNGIGFKPEYNEKIFEVFQRLHNQAEFSGTGVGLAICKRIVENHGGAINAVGSIGKGVTFNIYLPV